MLSRVCGVSLRLKRLLSPGRVRLERCRHLGGEGHAPLVAGPRADLDASWRKHPPLDLFRASRSLPRPRGSSAPPRQASRRCISPRRSTWAARGSMSPPCPPHPRLLPFHSRPPRPVGRNHVHVSTGTKRYSEHSGLHASCSVGAVRRVTHAGGVDESTCGGVVTIPRLPWRHCNT